MSLSFFRQVVMLARESFNKRSELMMGASALIISSLAAWVIRYRMFDYYENANFLRLSGENLDGSLSQLIFYTARGIERMQDITGRGADHDACGDH